MNLTILRVCLGVTGGAMLFLGAFHLVTDGPINPHWVVVAATGAVNCVVSFWASRRQHEKKSEN